MTEETKAMTKYVIVQREELDVLHDTIQEARDLNTALAITVKLKNRVSEEKPIVDWIDDEMKARLDEFPEMREIMKGELLRVLSRTARHACLKVSAEHTRRDDTELQTKLMSLCEILEAGRYGMMSSIVLEDPLVERINVQLRRLHTEITETHAFLKSACWAVGIEEVEDLSIKDKIRRLQAGAYSSGYSDDTEDKRIAAHATTIGIGLFTQVRDQLKHFMDMTDDAEMPVGALVAHMRLESVIESYEKRAQRPAESEVTSLHGTVSITGPREDVANVVKYLPDVEGVEQPHSNYERFGDDDPDWLPIHQFLGLLDGSGASEDWQGVEQFFMAWGMTVEQWARLTDNLRLTIDNASVVADVSHSPINFENDLRRYQREVWEAGYDASKAPRKNLAYDEAGTETRKRMIEYVTNLHRTIYTLHAQFQSVDEVLGLTAGSATPDDVIDISNPPMPAAAGLIQSAEDAETARRTAESQLRTAAAVFADWICGNHTEEVREAARRALTFVGMSDQAATDLVLAYDPVHNPVTKNRFITDVIKFNLAAGRTIDTFNTRQLALHTGLECEELAETLDALAVNTRLSGSAFLTLYQTTTSLKYLGDHFKRGDLDSLFDNADPRELLDGAIDRIVVSIGSMMSQGADVFGALNHVAGRNLAKLVNGVAIKDANGKIQKPEGWTKPNLIPFLHISKQPPKQ